MVDLALTEEVPIRRMELEKETRQDKTLLEIIATLLSGKKLMEPYNKINSERYSIEGDLLLIDNRVVVLKVQASRL